jgi:hypothetical protein
MKNLFTTFTTFTVAASLITSISPSAFGQSKPEARLLSGAYYTAGTMFHNSWREILNRNGKICIKIVDGPANNSRGRQEIMVSSVSNRGGNLYIDATNQQIEIRDVEELPSYLRSEYSTNLAAFSVATPLTWVLREHNSNKSDPRTTPEQSEAVEQCISTEGKYVRKLRGRVFQGRF